MLSYTCKTAIKAVLYLASKKTGEKAPIKEIAVELDASEHTVSKMLQTLVRQGVINSFKGPTGGFYITEQQLNQPIIHIVDAIDGSQLFKGCGLGFSKCSETHPCPIHFQYKEVRNQLEDLFRQKRVRDMYEPVNNGLAFLAG